jgi:hypothetical protein
MKRKKMWMFSSTGKSKAKPSGLNKRAKEGRCQPLIESFKQLYLKEKPDKKYNYLTDIYTKWRGNYLYFCERYKSEQAGKIKQEFEENFVRLEYLDSDSFNLSYFSYTGKWFQVASNLTLNDCLEIIGTNPNFHPIS